MMNSSQGRNASCRLTSRQSSCSSICPTGSARVYDRYDRKVIVEAAVEGENHEATSMYPKFLAEAEAEKNQAAVISFRNALAVEKIHRALYTQALDTHKAGKDLAAKPIFVCDVCGNTVPGAPPDTCPVCGAAKSRFFEVE